MDADERSDGQAAQVISQPSPIVPTLPLIKWQNVRSISRRVLETVGEMGSPAAARDVITVLLHPLYLLDNLYAVAVPALQGHRYAQHQLDALLRRLIASAPEMVKRGHTLLRSEADLTTGQCVTSDTNAVLNFDAAANLFIASARFYPPVATDAFADQSACVFALLTAASPVEQLIRANNIGGAVGLAAEIRWIANDLSRTDAFREIATGRFASEPSAQAINDPREPTPLAEWVASIGLLQGEWNPEIFKIPVLPAPPPGPPNPCLALLGKLVSAKATTPLILPPPFSPVWSDNITRVSYTTPCGGALLRIEGTRFGTEPGSTGLMLPRSGKCTPTKFEPGTWTDTRIEMTLPGDITSGPVGFVNLDFAESYDKWADSVNGALELLHNTGCSSGPLEPFQDHFHMCPAATSVNGFVGGVAVIDVFTVTGATPVTADDGKTVLTVQPGDTLTLSWTVANTSGVALRSFGSSVPLFSGGVSALNGLPSVSSVSFTANHKGPEKWTFQLRASALCGGISARDIDIYATKSPRIFIEHVEVTQCIQTSAQDVKLVKNKPTMVRVYVEHRLERWGSNRVTVTGRLKLVYLRGSSTGLSETPWMDPANGSLPAPYPMAMPGASIEVGYDPNVGYKPVGPNTDDTLNFFIPPALCDGYVRFVVEVRCVAFDKRGDFPGISETTVKQVPGLLFEPRRKLELRFVRVNWAGYIPWPDDCRSTLERATVLLPTPLPEIEAAIAPDLDFSSSHAHYLWSTDDEIASKKLVLAALEASRLNTACYSPIGSGPNPACSVEYTHIWVAFMQQDVGGYAEVGGTAAVVGFTTVFDALRRFDTVVAAHELGHCLNQIHLDAKCPNEAPFVPGELKEDTFPLWPDGGRLLQIPFDVMTNSTVAAPVDSSNKDEGLWDLMSYCPGRWTSVTRWARIWDYIGP